MWLIELARDRDDLAIHIDRATFNTIMATVMFGLVSLDTSPSQEVHTDLTLLYADVATSPKRYREQSRLAHSWSCVMHR